jgi:hypothetical protein
MPRRAHAPSVSWRPIPSGAITRSIIKRGIHAAPTKTTVLRRELTEDLSPARSILVLGHEKGKANASHHWVSYVEKERPDVAAKIIADVRVDIDHLDDEQVLRYAQRYYDDEPARDQWGSN